MAMDKYRRIPALFLLWFLVLSHQILSAVGDGQGGARYTSLEDEKPSVARILTDTIHILRKSHESSWAKVKSIIHEIQLQFFPPSLDFRGTESEVSSADGTGEKMKEAAEKSMRKSKMAVEESAKSAAEVVHKTAETMKEVISDKAQLHHDEV